VPPSRRVVGNTVITGGDRWHNSRADDRLMYSPYNGDVYSPGEHPLCSLCRGGNMRVAAAVLTMRSLSCTAVWCDVCSLGKYYVGQKPKAKLEPPDA